MVWTIKTVRQCTLKARGYIRARTDTTQQSGQTADKQVKMGYCIAYSSVNTEPDPTGLLSLNLKSDRGS